MTGHVRIKPVEPLIVYVISDDVLRNLMRDYTDEQLQEIIDRRVTHDDQARLHEQALAQTEASRRRERRGEITAALEAGTPLVSKSYINGSAEEGVFIGWVNPRGPSAYSRIAIELSDGELILDEVSGWRRILSDEVDQ